MIDITKSISTIKNFMGNASRTACNEYLYDALQDAVESMERRIQKKPAEVNQWRTVSCYKCPTCGGLLPIGKNFCCDCEQALDWNGITDNSELTEGGVKERLTWEKENGEWGLKGYDIKKVPSGLYGAICKLHEYEKSGIEPEQLRQIDGMYADRCREIAGLRKRLEGAEELAM